MKRRGLYKKTILSITKSEKRWGTYAEVTYTINKKWKYSLSISKQHCGVGWFNSLPESIQGRRTEITVNDIPSHVLQEMEKDNFRV